MQVRVLPTQHLVTLCRCFAETKRCSFRSGCCSHWRLGGSQPLRGPSGRLWPGSLGGVKRRCLVDCRKANCTEDGGSTPPPTLGAIPPPTTQETTNSWPLVSFFGNRCSCSRRAQKSRAGVPALEMQCDGARLAVTQQVGVRFPPSPYGMLRNIHRNQAVVLPEVWGGCRARMAVQGRAVRHGRVQAGRPPIAG